MNPDEFYAYKPALRAGRPAILRRTRGTKSVKMVLTEDRSAGNSVVMVQVPEVAQKRFSITDADVEELGRYALAIEAHYGRPMDVEWGRDGQDGKLYILQARPETVKARGGMESLKRYRIKARSAVLASGRAIGQRVGAGRVRLVTDASEMARVERGDVLVTEMTDPDWEPVMKRAAAIVTDRGGRTCHAAIIARELGIPAVVGCGDATHHLGEGQEVTVSCAEGETGNVYEGLLETEVIDLALDKMPPAPVKITMNVGNPELAFDFQRLPNAGIGLARLEFIIARMIGVHPKAVLDYPSVPDDLRQAVEEHAAGYADPVTFYVEKLVEGIGTLGAAFYPKPVIVRLSDFKSNEYSSLTGGNLYEPKEENPMLGFRGASRYVAPEFRACFELECRALKKVRDEMGLTNVEIMVPFVRTLGEARQVIDLLAENGLKRGREWASRHHDVRDPLQRDPCRRIPAVLRRILHRLQRHDPAHARARPGFSDRCAGVRRAGPGGEANAPPRDPGVPQGWQVCRYLWAGPIGPPGSREVADGGGDRESVAEPRYGSGNWLFLANEAKATVPAVLN